jgi:hypothetical protein
LPERPPVEPAIRARDQPTQQTYQRRIVIDAGCHEGEPFRMTFWVTD